MTCNLLTTKDPKERIFLTFDYSLAMDAGEYITEIDEVAVSVTAGDDPNPQDILTGTAAVAVDGASFQQPVEGGVDGVNYNIKATVNTSLNKRLTVTGILPVRSQ